VYHQAPTISWFLANFNLELLSQEQLQSDQSDSQINLSVWFVNRFNRLIGAMQSAQCLSIYGFHFRSHLQ